MKEITELKIFFDSIFMSFNGDVPDLDFYKKLTRDERASLVISWSESI